MTDKSVRMMIHLNLVIVALAVSYLTLFLADTHTAQRVCWVYAAVTGILAVVNMILEWRHRP